MAWGVWFAARRWEKHDILAIFNVGKGNNKENGKDIIWRRNALFDHVPKHLFHHPLRSILLRIGFTLIYWAGLMGKAGPRKGVDDWAMETRGMRWRRCGSPTTIPPASPHTDTEYRTKLWGHVSSWEVALSLTDPPPYTLFTHPIPNYLSLPAGPTSPLVLYNAPPTLPDFYAPPIALQLQVFFQK